MKKIPFVFPVLLSALIPAISCAQSNVTIYGWTDIGYVRETGKDWFMGENDSNALGFKGYEDIGGGNRVTYNLQTRFTLQNGQLESDNGAQWEGASNMGLAGNWGSLNFGRVNEVSTETFSVIDPFNQDGPASMIRSSQRLVRTSNTARYDSPVWNGFSLKGEYTLGEDTHTAGFNSITKTRIDNDGYALALRYDHGPAFFLGSWGRRADSNNSSMWNLGAAYTYGPFRFSLGYEQTHDKGWVEGQATRSELARQYGGTEGISSRQKSWVAGLKWNVGAGTADALFNYVTLKDAKVDGTAARLDEGKAKKFALGYTYSLSKRTQLYSKVSYTDYDNQSTANFYRGVGQDNDSVYTFQLGMFHKF